MRSSLAAFAGLLLVYGEKSCKKSVRFSPAEQSNKQIELSLHRPGGDEVQDREIMDKNQPWRQSVSLPEPVFGPRKRAEFS